MNETKVAPSETEYLSQTERADGSSLTQRVARTQTRAPTQVGRDVLRQVHSLTEHIGSAILALIVALAIWVAAINEQNPPREDFFPGDVPIEVLNKPTNLVLFQPFERAARVRIRAAQSSWDRLQSNGPHAFIDLAGATAGQRDFDVHIQFGDSDITILSVDPPRITLRLEEQREKTFSVTASVADSPPIGFNIGAPQVAPATAQVSGAQSLVDQVVEVVAIAQLRGAKSAVEAQTNLIPRDAQGNTVAGVRLSPSSVTVRVPVEQRIGFKDVSVKVVTKGNVASGYWLSNIAVEPSTITVVGSPARLDEIGGFIPTEAIEVSDVRSSFIRSIGLRFPEGISPVNTQNVRVTIDVSAITGGQTVQRQVTVRGLDPTLKASVSPETVDLILAGPLPVLQSLKPDDVQVIIDLAGKPVGKYKVAPTVIKPESLKVESIVPDTIEVVISK